MKSKPLKKFAICVPLLFLVFTSTIRASDIFLDQLASVYFDENQKFIANPVNKSMSCNGKVIAYTRIKNSPKSQLSIDGKNIPLAESCYFSMDCVSYRQKPSLLIVDTPACGGNAVPEIYRVFDIESLKQTQLTYQAAKEAKFIEDEPKPNLKKSPPPIVEAKREKPISEQKQIANNSSNIRNSAGRAGVDNYAAGLCAIGILIFTKEDYRKDMVLDMAVNRDIALRHSLNVLYALERRPDGGFTKRSLQELMMNHDYACQSIGVKSAIR